MRNSSLRIEEVAAVAERVGRNVDDAHSERVATQLKRSSAQFPGRDGASQWGHRTQSIPCSLLENRSAGAPSGLKSLSLCALLNVRAKARTLQNRSSLL